MNIAMMQPSFLPWQGYFELILKSDVFILLDDFQFSVQSYHQRNRLFVSRGVVDWCSVPIKKAISFKAPLNQVVIDEGSNWREKLWRLIKANYSKSEYFDLLCPWLESWVLKPAQTLSSQNIEFIKYVSDLLNYDGQFCCSSELPSEKVRSERVVELLRWRNAKTYLCAHGSFGYMLDDKVFPIPDVTVHFQNFQPEPYVQIGSVNEFIPYLSILDALMNVGPVETRKKVMSGTSKWLTWDEIKD